jgi:hypothetical protein
MDNIPKFVEDVGYIKNLKSSDLKKYILNSPKKNSSFVLAGFRL